MQQLILLIFLLISGQALAHNCDSQSDQSSCFSVSGCVYNITESSCINKCDGLFEIDCTSGTNASYCRYTYSSCYNQMDCKDLQYQTNQFSCEGYSTCKFTPAAGTCTNNTTALTTLCSSIVSTEDWQTGEKYYACNHIPGLVCSYQAGQCASRTSVLACDTRFCIVTPTECSAILPVACNATTPKTCNNQAGCSWNVRKRQCVDHCTMFNNNDSQCLGQQQCQVTSNFTCIDKPISSIDKFSCESYYTKGQCELSGFCSTALSKPDQYVPYSNYCSLYTTNETCNKTYCTFTVNAGQHDTCTQIFDCTPLDKNSCLNRFGCSYPSLGNCSNSKASSCDKNDNQNTCTGTGKFCNFSYNGQCIAIFASTQSILTVITVAFLTATLIIF